MRDRRVDLLVMGEERSEKFIMVLLLFLPWASRVSDISCSADHMRARQTDVSQNWPTPTQRPEMSSLSKGLASRDFIQA